MNRRRMLRPYCSLIVLLPVCALLVSCQDSVDTDLIAGHALGDMFTLATQVELDGVYVSGQIDTPSEMHFFRFESPAAAALTADIPGRLTHNLSVALYDAHGNELTADRKFNEYPEVVWNTVPSGTYYASVSSYYGEQGHWGELHFQSARYEFSMRLDEHANEREDATPALVAPDSFVAEIEYPYDTDYIPFYAKSSHRYMIEVNGIDLTAEDLVVGLESNTAWLRPDRRTEEYRDTQLEWTCKSEGVYYIFVEMNLFSDQRTGRYEVAVSDVTTPPWREYEESDILADVSYTPLTEEEIYVPDDEGPALVIDRLIVKAAAGVSRSDLAHALAPFDSAITGQLSDSMWYEVGVIASTLPDLERLRDELMALSETDLVEINWLLEQAGVPVPLDVELARNEYGMYWSDRINLPGAARFLSKEDTSGRPRFDRLDTVKVAVIDGGIDASHPDLDDALSSPSLWANYSLTAIWSAEDIADGPNGHGSSVAGLIGAEVGNAQECAGSSDSCLFGRFNGASLGIAELIPIKVIAHLPVLGGVASSWDIGSAVTHAEEVGARVINLSLASSSVTSWLDSLFLSSVLQTVSTDGVILVAGAGNSAGGVQYPASHPDVIAVGGTDENDRRYTSSCFSDDSSVLPIAAPAHQVVSTVPPDSEFADEEWDYYYSLASNGTSLASPIVSGVVAIMLSIDDSLTRAEAIDILKSTADEIEVTYPGEIVAKHTWSRLNAYRAVAETWRQRHGLVNAEPVVFIVRSGPLDGVIAPGRPVVFEAYADDLEDAPLEDSAIVWTSDRDGEIGFGPWFETSSLSVGAHMITVQVTDADGATGSDTVELFIGDLPEEHPRAEDATLSVPYETARTIALAGTDPSEGPEPLSFHITLPPAHGSLSDLVGNEVIYTPDAAYIGKDSFEFSVSDGAYTSDDARVSIDVVPALLAPAEGARMDNRCRNSPDQRVWDFEWVDIPSATRYHLYVIGFDANPVPLIAPIIDDQQITESSYRDISDGGYIADGNRFGWTWKVRALVGGSWSGWSEIRSFDVESQDTDCQGISFYTLSITGDEQRGKVRVNGSLLSLPIEERFSDGHEVNLTAHPEDGWAFSHWSGAIDGSDNPESITMTGNMNVVVHFVPESNRPPTAQEVVALVPFETPREITLRGSDPDGGPDSLQYNITSWPLHGSLSAINGNIVTYTPHAGYSGDDSFYYRACDGAACSDSALVSIDVLPDEDDSGTISLVGSLPFGTVYDVAVSGSRAYVAAWNEGLVIVDASSPEDPVQMGSAEMNVVSDVSVESSMAYVLTGEYVKAIDVSNPDNPIVRGTVFVDDAGAMHARNKICYVSSTSVGLQIIDFSNPASPRKRGLSDVPFAGLAWSLYSAGQHAYVLDTLANDSALWIVNTSNLDAPEIVGSYDGLRTAQGVFVTGNKAYVADLSALRILGVSQPSTPTLLGEVTGLDIGAGDDVVVESGRAYVAGTFLVAVVDVASPASPSVLATYDALATSIVYGNGLIYVGGGSNLLILRYTP